jgi:hypothetical protein
LVSSAVVEEVKSIKTARKQTGRKEGRKEGKTLIMLRFFEYFFHIHIPFS